MKEKNKKFTYRPVSSTPVKSNCYIYLNGELGNVIGEGPPAHLGHLGGGETKRDVGRMVGKVGVIVKL